MATLDLVAALPSLTCWNLRDTWFASSRTDLPGQHGTLMSRGARPRAWQVHLDRGHDAHGKPFARVEVYPRGRRQPAFPAKRNRALKRRAAFEHKHRVEVYSCGQTTQLVGYGLPRDGWLLRALARTLLTPGCALLLYPTRPGINDTLQQETRPYTDLGITCRF